MSDEKEAELKTYCVSDKHPGCNEIWCKRNIGYAPQDGTTFRVKDLYLSEECIVRKKRDGEDIV